MESTTRSPAMTSVVRMRGRLGEMTRRSLWSMSGEEVADLTTEVQGLVNQANALLLELVTEADRRGLGVAAGAANTQQWLAGKLNVPPSDAGSMVKLTRHLHEELPATTEALARGDISVAHAKAVSRAVLQLPSQVSTPDLRRQVEATLADQATTFDAKVLSGLGARSSTPWIPSSRTACWSTS